VFRLPLGLPLLEKISLSVNKHVKLIHPR